MKDYIVDLMLEIFVEKGPFRVSVEIYDLFLLHLEEHKDAKTEDQLVAANQLARLLLLLNKGALSFDHSTEVRDKILTFCASNIQKFIDFFLQRDPLAETFAATGVLS
jgi:hypothetical protein